MTETTPTKIAGEIVPTFVPTPARRGEPYLLLSNRSGSTQFPVDEAACAAFGRAAMRILGDPETTWDSDTLQALGGIAASQHVLGPKFDFDLLLDEHDVGLDEDGNVIEETDDESEELDEDELGS